jgi:hypothetical protein
LTLSHDNTTWRKSSRSETQGACVELGNTGAVRDSKNQDGGVLHAQLGDLLAAVKAGRIVR